MEPPSALAVEGPGGQRATLSAAPATRRATGLARRPVVFSRRRLIARWLMAVACVPMAGVAASMVRHRKRGRPPRRIQVTPNFRDDGIAMADGIIVSRAPDAPMAVLSASCTHLGCRVSRVDDGLLVCPCHGSRFHRDGSVAQGPATQALAQLDFSVDSSTGTISVDLA